uniref:Uncharacterized protein n=1 Tax=Arundo donax TaxID=35708 RepID=A0A0A9BSC2_ARUDO
MIVLINMIILKAILKLTFHSWAKRSNKPWIYEKLHSSGSHILFFVMIKGIITAQFAI